MDSKEIKAFKIDNEYIQKIIDKSEHDIEIEILEELLRLREDVKQWENRSKCQQTINKGILKLQKGVIERNKKLEEFVDTVVASDITEWFDIESEAKALQSKEEVCEFCKSWKCAVAYKQCPKCGNNWKPTKEDTDD